MRFLVACPDCRRQFDVTGRPIGSRLPCSCGGEVVVPQPHAHDAAVVRCSSCGAPRTGGERACRFCASELTLHERDLDTLCSGCMARVSGKARFCHHCSTPILQGQSALQAEQSCPACAGSRPLRSRRLGAANVALLECQSCGGLWIDKEIFEVLADRARAGKMPDGWASGGIVSAPAATEGTPATERTYRPCLVCGALMNRRNYGRKSGVIVDVCAKHGLWFDLHEMDRLLRWIRDSGEERAEKLVREEEASEARLKVLSEGLKPWAKESEKHWLSQDGRGGGGDAALIRFVSEGLRRFFG